MSTVEKAVEKLRRTPSAVKMPPVETPEPDAPDTPTQVDATSADATSVPLARAPLTLNLQQLRVAGLLPPEEMQARVRDEYRLIKRRLLANLVVGAPTEGGHLNRIMVTSALAGEGKSFTSMNLALSLAQEHDLSVMLIDGDVVRPSISELLGLAHAPGLIDLLSDDAINPSSLVVQTDLPNLSVLPAGKSRPLMPELLSSARMDLLLQRLERMHGYGRRILLFDSPPLLAAAEALALSGAAGLVLVVVKAGHTLQQQLKGAVELISPEKIVNLVLNQTLRAHGVDYYGGYYGYHGHQD